MGSLKLNYRLTQEEAEEAIVCLNWKREGRYKNINVWVMSILGVLLSFAYMRAPEQSYLFFLLLFITLLLFYLTYGRSYTRKRRARRIAQSKGEYRIELQEKCLYYGDKRERISLEESHLMVLSSDSVYTMKVGRETFVIPVRILSAEEKKELEYIIDKYVKNIIHIEIRKE